MPKDEYFGLKKVQDKTTRKPRPLVYKLIEKMFLTKINTILANWKTTLFGIGALAGGVGTIVTALSDGFQVEDVKIITAAGAVIMSGFGNIFGKDADKSNAPHANPVAKAVPED